MMTKYLITVAVVMMSMAVSAGTLTVRAMGEEQAYTIPDNNCHMLESGHRELRDDSLKNIRELTDAKVTLEMPEMFKTSKGVTLVFNGTVDGYSTYVKMSCTNY